MLGGMESFVKGKYDRTPIGELLPVYLNRLPEEEAGKEYKLSLTREGWLEPWTRIRSTEDAERTRLKSMPEFKTVNRVAGIKPGASVLARVTSDDGDEHPALVVQRFGKGRASALLVGDLWRWQLRKKSTDESDLEKSWRQTVRWLVAVVPQRIEVDVRRKQDDPNLPVEVNVKVRDELFDPLDNATVAMHVTDPTGEDLELTAEPSDTTPGVYTSTFVPRAPGAYRAALVVTAADGSEIGQRETGWTSEPAAEEFSQLQPNRALLERIAKETGGEVIAADDLEDFVSDLPNRKIPVTEPWTYPLWHKWFIFAFAIGCLVSEWGLRRVAGLP